MELAEPFWVLERGMQGLWPHAQQNEKGVFIQSTTQVKIKQLKSKIPPKIIFLP